MPRRLATRCDMLTASNGGENCLITLDTLRYVAPVSSV
jgi:hypothetical protein